jgi:hypothetical protein
VAVYVVLAANVAGDPDHAIVVEYSPLSVVLVCGVLLFTGAVIAIAAISMTAFGVVTEFEALEATDVPLPLLAVTVNV